MKDCILTLDAGTTGLKCSVFDENGKLICACTAAYGVDYPQKGWAQQSAEQFYAAAIQALADLRGKFDPERIAVIGLSGTMNGCLPVDAEGRALYPNIIHSDTRAEEHLQEIRQVIGEEEYYRRTGNRIDVHFALPKLLWLKKYHPDVFKKTACVLNTKDAIYGFLTGNYHRTDYSDASLTCMFRLDRKDWDRDLLRDLGISAEILPEVVASDNIDARLTPSAAEMLGLPSGIPVSMGAGDACCATHGAGISQPGRAYCSLGSSAWIAMLSDKPLRDPLRRAFSYLDMDGKHYDICGTVQCAAAASDWTMENLFLGHKPDAGEFAVLEKLASSAPVGSHGLFFLPTFMGERTPWWDNDARGAFIGMTCSHTRGDSIRAVYEGIAQGLHQCAIVMQECGLGFDALGLIGGGAMSSLWPQIFADAFALPVSVPADPRSATSVGAAAAAGVGIGLFRDYDEAASHVSAARTWQPDKEASEAYAEHFELYRKLYGWLAPAYHAISRYQEKHMKNG